VKPGKDAKGSVGPHILLLLITALCAGCHSPAYQAGPQPIHGYVYAILHQEAAAAIAAATNEARVAVPDIVVAAKNVTTGALSPPTRTDPYGYFRTPGLLPGSYNICVRGAGYISKCDPQVITISDQMHVMDHLVSIEAEQRVIIGNVLLADKETPCFWYDPTFDANYVLTAKVSLISGSGTLVAGPVRGNNLGEYVMATDAAPGTYKVAVDCEAEHTVKTVTLSTGAGATQEKFVLANNAPTANLIEAAKTGVGVRRASPGDGLTALVRSTDADNDRLHYRWVDESDSAARFPDAASVSWSAPTLTGPHTLRVLVADGRGGHAISRTIINVGPDRMRFTGTVFNRATHAAIAGASVSLDGVATTTDAAGHFEVNVPEAKRFVLNVSKAGFVLASRIFYARATGIQVPLDAVQTATLEGSRGGTVAVKVVECTLTENRQGRAAVSRGDPSECPRQEIGSLTFVFSADSLVARGQPFAGTAAVEGFQLDLTLPDAIPGDLSAKYQGGDVRLETFGSFHIQARDLKGNPLQLAPGKSVGVSMPIHPLALASAPARIAFFSYDESSGFWVADGGLRRSGNNYVGKLTHFREFNASLIHGSSSCMKLQLGQGPGGFPASVGLDVSYVNSRVGKFNHPQTVVNDTTNPLVIERLVPDQDFILRISDGSTNAVLQTVSLNSGPPVLVPFPAPYPYDGCRSATIFNGSSRGPTWKHFLIEATTRDNSTDYRNQTTMGDYAGRDTFAHWLSANGFGADASETRAIYFNDRDLKFGRSVHCRAVSHFGSTFSRDWVACYASSFGSVGVAFNQQASNPLTDAYRETNVIETVAMEYHPDKIDKVQFWAFKGDGRYFKNPVLDAEGNKPMPDVCIGCHQGSYGGPGLLVNGAAFLPFDVGSFVGDDGQPLQNTLGAGKQRPTQADFRQLNLFALQSSDRGSGVNAAYERLMDLWYADAGHPAGVNDPAATFHFNHGAVALNVNTLRSLAADTAFQADAVKPVCRIYHVARNPTLDTWGQLTQSTTNAAFIHPHACGAIDVTPHHCMAHTETPYERLLQQSFTTTLAAESAVACPL
jgi:hypothetical protein